MAKDTSATAAPLPFETAIDQLEALVTQMEKGNMPLDETLALFQNGIELTQTCQQHLDKTELTIKHLTQTDTQDMDKI